MSKKKWTMKQYWRVMAVRGITGSALWALVLGGFYYKYIPALETMGLIGAVILALPIILIFLAIGYVYDSTFKLWNQQKQVLIERNPYQFVPRPRDFVFYYPLMFLFIRFIDEVSEKVRVSSGSLTELRNHYATLFSLDSQQIEDLNKSREMSQSFLTRMPFKTSGDQPGRSSTLWNKVKFAFSVQLWRLTQIQNLWGIFSDTLVVAALYSVHLPSWSDELLGIGVLAFIMVVSFLVAGWIYDRRFKLWSPLMVVAVERNIYTYVATPHDIMLMYPFVMSTMTTLGQIVSDMGGDMSDIRAAEHYLQEFFTLSDKEDESIDHAKRMSQRYSRCFESKGVD